MTSPMSEPPPPDPSRVRAATAPTESTVSPAAAGAPKIMDTIDRISDDVPTLDTSAVKAGRLDDTPSSLVHDYLKAMPTLPRVGSVIAERWRIERLLGEGGFGAVFEGRDQELGRKVAIKVMRADGAAPTDAAGLRHAITQIEERRRRFRDEARAVARAESPNVVTVYDVGEHTAGDGQSWPFLVLELVPGTPLDQVVASMLTPEVALHILMQLAQGVATLHARGVVHRDLKPANAIVTPDGVVKIIDFGLAIAASNWTEIKGPKPPEDWIEGTPNYMSPEVTAGAEPDAHSDLWALGVIAYELMTGRSPWGDHLMLSELHRRIAEVDPPPLTGQSQNVQRFHDGQPLRGLRFHADGQPLRGLRFHAHIAPIVSKLLEKRPTDRFQSAAELVAALGDLRIGTARTAAPARDNEQPFRYLLAFEEKDAAWFFGREEITAKLVLALEQRGRLVIAGPSGAGKTSLVQAGLIPELKVLRPLTVVRVQPGRDPLARLAAAVPGELSADDVRLRPGLVGERLRQHAKQTKTRVLVQVDALEELITQDAPPADVEVFGQAIDGLRDADRQVLLVMAVRDEYLGRLPRMSRALESTLRDAEFLGPPPRAAMIAALTRPVERLGWSWEPAFPEEMVDTIADQASPLPVLQLAASWVWEKGAADGAAAQVLTRKLLAGDGEALRIGDVLGQYADHKLRAASWSEADRELVKRMLPVMVSAEGTPLIVPIEDIVARSPEPARGRELLRDLTDFRLLTSLRDERARECLTPVHTTLIRSWSLMREALEGSAELETFLRRFERDASEWQASGKDPAKVWPAAALRDFERWAVHLQEVRLSHVQIAFRATVEAAARRARWLRWGLVGVLAVLALTGTWAGIAYSSQADEAEAQAARAEAQTRASEEHRREADELIDFMLGDLRRRLEKIGQIKVLHVVAEKARDYLDARKDSHINDAARRAAVLRNLSAVFLGEGATDAAEKAGRDALAVSEQLVAAKSGDEAAKRELALSITGLGHILVQKGDNEGARERYETALAMYQASSAATSDDAAVLLEYVIVNDRLGDVYGRLGLTERALAVQKTSLASAERIVVVDPTSPRAKRNVVILRNKIGVTPSLEGDGVDSRVTAAELQAFEDLAKADPESALAKHDLVIGHLGRGNQLTAQGDLGAAIPQYREALALVQKLATEDPDNALMFVDVVYCHNKVGDALARSGDLAGSIHEHEAALVIATRLATADPTNEQLEQELAHTLTRIGESKLLAGDLAGALVAHENALTLREQLAVASKRDDDDQAHLARALGHRAEVLRARADTADSDKAHADVARALAIMAPFIAKPGMPKGWAELNAWLIQLRSGTP